MVEPKKTACWQTGSWRKANLKDRGKLAAKMGRSRRVFVPEALRVTTDGLRIVETEPVFPTRINRVEKQHPKERLKAATKWCQNEHWKANPKSPPQNPNLRDRGKLVAKTERLARVFVPEGPSAIMVGLRIVGMGRVRPTPVKLAQKSCPKRCLNPSLRCLWRRNPKGHGSAVAPTERSIRAFVLREWRVTTAGLQIVEMERVHPTRHKAAQKSSPKRCPNPNPKYSPKVRGKRAVSAGRSIHAFAQQVWRVTTVGLRTVETRPVFRVDQYALDLDGMNERLPFNRKPEETERMYAA